MGSSSSKKFQRKPSSRKRISQIIYTPSHSQMIRHYIHDEDSLNALLSIVREQRISLPDDVSLEGPRDREISRFRLVGKVNVALQLCSRCRDAGKPFMMDTYYIDREEVAQIRTILCEGCIGYYLMVLSDRCGLLLNDTMH